MPVSSSISPPTSLFATVDPGEVTLSWDRSESSVDGYHIYENGILVGETPSILPVFEFPFDNESLSTPLIIFSEGENFTFGREIEPYTTYIYEVCAFIGDTESSRVSISVRYEPYITITGVSVLPNPVYVNGDLSISAFVETGIHTFIS